jgi:hypothetical protein
MRNHPYIEVTYRDGKPFAAYLYLSTCGDPAVATTRRVRPGLVADFAADGALVGLEIVHPSRTTRAELLQVLRELHVTDITEEQLEPIGA